MRNNVGILQNSGKTYCVSWHIQGISRYTDIQLWYCTTSNCITAYIISQYAILIISKHQPTALLKALLILLCPFIFCVTFHLLCCIKLHKYDMLLEASCIWYLQELTFWQLLNPSASHKIEHVIGKWNSEIDRPKKKIRNGQ